VKIYKTITSAFCGPILHYYKRILYYLQTFYAHVFMYISNHLCSYICSTDVQYFPEDNQDRTKHVAVMIN